MTEIEFEKAIEQIKSIPLFSSELDFYIAVIKSHKNYFNSNSFDLIFYREPNIHIETWRIALDAEVLLINNEEKIHRHFSMLGNHIYLPLGKHLERTVISNHIPFPRMGSGKKTIWFFKDQEWQIRNSKGTWIG